MSFIERSVEIEAPAEEVFRRWTDFEAFPSFSQSVREVVRLDETRLRWNAAIAGVREVWESEIIEQVPARRVSWCSTSGPSSNGSVDFEPLSESTTRMTLKLEYLPSGWVELLGAGLGLLGHYVEKELQGFKRHVEEEDAMPALLPRAEDLVGQ
jgi:uncharacterized membrane protein